MYHVYWGGSGDRVNPGENLKPLTPLLPTDQIGRRRLSSVKDPLFEAAWSLYETSFSIHERRMIDDQKKIMDHPLYHFEVLILEEVFLGILLWWQFEKIRYVEHYAIIDAQKAKGYGTQVLEDFKSEYKELIMLEVEIPKDEIQKRRISFYERRGFHLNPYPYIQPAYSKTGNPVPLLLMSWPSTITNTILEYFIGHCHSIVFGK